MNWSSINCHGHWVNFWMRHSQPITHPSHVVVIATSNRNLLDLMVWAAHPKLWFIIYFHGWGPPIRRYTQVLPDIVISVGVLPSPLLLTSMPLFIASRWVIVQSLVAMFDANGMQRVITSEKWLPCAKTPNITRWALPGVLAVSRGSELERGVTRLPKWSAAMERCLFD